jgi:hypothetical protein
MGHNLCPIDDDQVLGLSGFCGRMDHDAVAPPPWSPRSTEACTLMALLLSTVSGQHSADLA